MINELFFWGFIGFVFLVSLLSYAYIIGPYILEGAASEREVTSAILSGGLYDFHKYCLLFIGLVLVVASIVSIVSGSWPNWFFFSKGYFVRIIIVLVVSKGITKIIDFNRYRRYRKESAIKQKVSQPKLSHLLLVSGGLIVPLTIGYFISSKIPSLTGFRVLVPLVIFFILLIVIIIYENK